MGSPFLALLLTAAGGESIPVAMAAPPPSTVECTAARLRRFVGPTGVHQAWPRAGKLPPGVVDGRVLLSDTSVLADGYRQWLVVDAANRAAYVVQSGGIAGFCTIYGPLPVAACTSPAP